MRGKSGLDVEARNSFKQCLPTINEVRAPAHDQRRRPTTPSLVSLTTNPLPPGAGTDFSGVGSDTKTLPDDGAS